MTPIRFALSLFLLLLPAVTLAQQRIVACDDGRVVLLTPFNATNPCADKVVIDPAKDIPDEFLYVFGPPPEPTQRSLHDRIARMEYQQALRVFDGIVDMPEGYFHKPRGQPTASMTIAEYYELWGLGRPVAYKDTRGLEYVRWPDALYHPHRASVAVALLGPGMVVAQWQAEAVYEGICVYELQDFAARSTSVSTKNSENCAEVERSLAPPGQ